MFSLKMTTTTYLLITNGPFHDGLLGLLIKMTLFICGLCLLITTYLLINNILRDGFTY